MLYVCGNNCDTDDAEYYVNHLVFAVLPELDGDILYTVLSFKAAPRWLRALRHADAIADGTVSDHLFF